MRGWKGEGRKRRKRRKGEEIRGHTSAEERKWLDRLEKEKEKEEERRGGQKARKC